MPATAKIQHTSLLEAQERHGAMQRMVMVSRVIGLTNTDYLVLTDALEAAGIPTFGTALPGVPNLILTERNPTIVDNDKGTVDVNLVYEHFNNDGQSYQTPLAGILTAQVKASVQQISTNIDRFGKDITTSHTFPPDDPDFPSQTQTQGGQVDVFVGQRGISVEGINTTARPWLIVNQIIGSVNSGSWAGESPRKWMCVGVGWTLWDATPGANRYKMSFEFQHNPDGWDPSIVFIDQRTGKPPKDLVKGTGYKTIKYHRAVDFNRVIGVRVQQR